MAPRMQMTVVGNVMRALGRRPINKTAKLNRKRETSSGVTACCVRYYDRRGARPVIYHVGYGSRFVNQPH